MFKLFIIKFFFLQISLPSEKRRNSTALYNPMSIAQLQNEYPYLKWRKYLNRILYPYVELSEDEIVNVPVPKYLEDLGNLLATTPNRTLANHVMSKVVVASTGEMGDKVQDILREYGSIFSGTNVKKQRWYECVNDVSDSLSLAAGALYVRNHFDKSAKQNVEEILENLRLSFKNILKEVKLIDLLFMFYTENKI